MTLSADVDALFAVVRLDSVETPTLDELARQLQNCRASVLGFVATGVSRGDGYRYGYDAYGYKSRTTDKTAERV
jgi:hypothetical protein